MATKVAQQMMFCKSCGKQTLHQKNIKEIRYQGLMIGIDLAFPCNEVRTRLVKEYKMLTGNASTPNTLRVLPALNVKKEDVKKFADALIQILNEY